MGSGDVMTTDLFQLPFSGSLRKKNCWKLEFSLTLYRTPHVDCNSTLTVFYRILGL